MNEGKISSEESDGEVDYKNSDLVKCRFYERRVPEKDEIVAVVTTDIKELGAYVRLLEYDNIEGFIMLSQVTAKRVKTVQRHLKIGQQQMMEVLRVDEAKMCIDLSKKSIKPEAVEIATKRYKKAKQVHTIMRQTAIKLNTKVEELYEQFGWELYKKFDHAYDAFRIALTDPDTAFADVNISPEQKTVLVDTIRRKMQTNPLKIRVDFALTCTSFEGVDVIKEALLTAKHAVNDEVWQLEFKMIAPPNYKCEVITHSKVEGEAKLREALKIIKEVMKRKGGHFKQKSEPTVIGASKDDADNDNLIEKYRNKNDEDGEDQDEEEEDNEEGMGDFDIDVEDSGAVEVDGDEEEQKQQQ